MEYMIIIWIITIFISCGTNVINYLRKFKDAADCGYKINILKLEKIEREKTVKKEGIATNSIVSPEIFLNLIPIINLMVSIGGIIEYNKIKSKLIKYYDEIKVLVKMSESEQREYLRSKSVFKAYNISARNEYEIFFQDLIGENSVNSSLDNVSEEVTKIEFKESEMLDNVKYEVFADINADDEFDTTNEDVRTDDEGLMYSKKIGTRRIGNNGRKKS